MRSRVTFGLVIALGSAALLSASPSGPAARADADALRQKVLQIATNGMADSPQPRETAVTDEEVNAYIQSLPAEERFAARLKLAELPRNSSPTRIRNRCDLSGRPRGYYRKLRMSRIALRDLGSQGLIPGMVKSSW